MRAAFVLAMALLAWAPVGRAERALVHVVRPGETLAAIAERYYGDPRRESMLVAENGLTSQGGSAIVVGLRLRVPTVSYHRVADDETWAAIASRYYGDPRRAFVIVEANGGSAGKQPDSGAEVVIPYPLRHVVAQGESLRGLAKTYYRSLKQGMGRIRRFNELKKGRLLRGQIVLVPMEEVVFTEEIRKALASEAPVPEAGQVRDKQTKIDAQLPALREHVKGGRYADAVQMANRLLGGSDLSARQIVSIERELATALVALDRTDLAEQAFLTLLEEQPDYELDSVKTSPKVLRAFEAARKRHVPRAQLAAPAPPVAPARPDAAVAAEPEAEESELDEAAADEPAIEPSAMDEAAAPAAARKRTSRRRSN